MYIPFQTTFEQWWETHSVRSDLGLVRIEMRMARRLGRTYDRVLKAKEHIKKEFDKEGIITDEEMYKAYNEYHKELKESVEELKKITIEFKTLLNRDLDELEALEHDIAENDRGAGQDALIKEIHAMMGVVESTIETFFKQLTSFHSVNLSAQQLLGRASQIRELYYKLRQSRKDEKEFKRDIKAVDSAERAGKKPSPKAAEKALAALKATLQDQTLAIGVALLIFQEMLKEIEDQQREVWERVQNPPQGRGRYPEDWANEHIALLGSITAGVEQWVTHEISAGRLFISKAKHAEAERLAA